LAIGPNDDFAHRLAPDASLASPHVDDRAAAICSLSSLVMRRLEIREGKFGSIWRP
jgi:hypothetical protein